MPHMHRPQTLKQAKKAYRKSGATVRLSESELAIIERRGVLQERADRIKEREARRKANIKRKEERNQRERETKARMGIMEPAKEGITNVGPSQLSLGGFLGAGRKRKRNEEEEKAIDLPRVMTGLTRAEREFWKDQEEKKCYTSVQRTPWRNPLKVISANLTARKSPSENIATAGTSLNKDSSQTKMAPPQLSSRDSLQTIADPMPAATGRGIGSGVLKKCARDDEYCRTAMMAPPPLRKPTPPGPPKRKKPLQKPLQKTEGAHIPVREELETEQVRPMAPPPRLPLLRHRPSDTNNQQEPAVTALQDKSPDPADECWDDFFVSGTQIARELSPPAINRLPDTRLVSNIPSHTAALPPTVPENEPRGPNINNVPPSPPGPSSQSFGKPSLTPAYNAEALLDFISTQDLDFSGVLTQATPHIMNDDTDDVLAQISTQDLNFSGELTQAPARAPSTGSSDFNEDITEEDLEDVALEFERESTLAKSRTTTPHPPKPPIYPWRWGVEDIYPKHFMEGSPIFSSANSNKVQAIAFEDSDDGWGGFDLHSSCDIASWKADGEIKQEVKAELDLQASASQSYSQDVKVEADYDAFGLSTQDLVDFEYDSLTWIH